MTHKDRMEFEEGWAIRTRYPAHHDSAEHGRRTHLSGGGGVSHSHLNIRLSNLGQVKEGFHGGGQIPSKLKVPWV